LPKIFAACHGIAADAFHHADVESFERLVAITRQRGKRSETRYCPPLRNKTSPRFPSVSQ